MAIKMDLVRQSCNSCWKEFAETFIVFGGLIYIWSPWTAAFDFYSFQAERICGTICWLTAYFIFSGICRLGTVKDVLISLNLVDGLVAICFLLFVVRIFVSQEMVDQEIIWGVMASVGVYVSCRKVGKTCVNWIVWSMPFLLVGQLAYGVERAGGLMFVERVSGSFFNTGIWGCFLACSIVMMCQHVYLTKRLWVKIFFTVACILGCVLLFFTFSRAAWLGCVAGVGYFVICGRSGTKRSVYGGIIVIAILLFALPKFSSSAKSDSIRGRLLIWKVAAVMGTQSSCGLGIDGFRRNYMAYQKEYLAQADERERLLADENHYAFNEGIRIWVEWGWLGVCGLAVFVYLFLRDLKCFSRRWDETSYARGVLVTWVVFALFSYPVANFQMRMLFIAFLAIWSCGLPVIWKFQGRWIPLTVSVVCLSVAWGMIPYYRAWEYWERCIEKGHVDQVEKLEPVMNSSFMLSNCARLLNKKGDYLQAERLARRCSDEYHSYFAALELGNSLKALGRFEEAGQAWEEACHLLPNRFTPLFLQMEMWREQEDWDRAGVFAREMLEKRIKVRSSRLTYMLMRAREMLNILKRKKVCM